jgi:hypothetical protein
MAIACQPAFLAASCGYVGASDGCSLLSKFKSLLHANLAEEGNVAATGRSIARPQPGPSPFRSLAGLIRRKQRNRRAPGSCRTSKRYWISFYANGGSGKQGIPTSPISRDTRWICTVPLVWAHSEYIELLRSLHGNAVWDMPPQTVDRYLKSGRTADFQIWTTNQRRAWLAPGKNLRVDLNGPAQVQWTADQSSNMIPTSDSGFGLHSAMLSLSRVGAGAEIAVKVTPDILKSLVRDSHPCVNCPCIT